MIKQILSLEHIISGCAANDNRFKELLYKRYYGYLMSVITRYLKDANDAQELLNDSFVKIFKHITGFSLPADPEAAEKAFKGWIAKISSRTAIDFLKKKNRVVYVEEIAEIHTQVIYTDVLSSLNYKYIIHLLDELPEIQRLIFNLYEIEGFSHEEIGKLLNIPDNTCRTYLTRAKAKLRKLYTQSLIHPDGTN